MFPHYNHKTFQKLLSEVIELDEQFVKAYKEKRVSDTVKLAFRYKKIYPEYLNQKDAKQIFLNP